MLPYQIKSAGIADIPTIIELAEATWYPAYSSILSQEQISFMLTEIYSPASLLQQMQHEKQQFLLLYVAHEPAGFASYSPKGENIFKLNKLYVLPKLHGKGFGKVLINHVEQTLKELGGAIVELNVNRQNPAKAFYESLGFQVFAEVDIPIGPYWMNDYVMRKPLNQQ